MDYYSEHEGRVYTEVELRLMGITEGEAISALGLSPLRYVMPAYDAGLYTVEPDGDPFFDGQVYVQLQSTLPHGERPTAILTFRGFKFKVQHPVLGYWRLLKKLHRVS